ncbi:MAG: DNA cytosine methyltransferase, partial [Bdellovibrionales bacterium]|nr:DNA cytosine methyltransferase [Bdellovibrionales bacterium]
MSNPGKLRLVELYAGTGRAFEPFRHWRNVELALMADNNPYAAKVYKHNFPNAPYITADLGSFSSRDLERQAGGRVDILIGCPPCQGFSDGGSRDPYDARNGHITRFMSYVRDLKPLVVALENVPLAASSGRFRKVIQGLEACGYAWTATIANSALWGSCQSRQRLILVAFKKEVAQEIRLPRAQYGGGEYYSYHLQKECGLQEDV